MITEAEYDEVKRAAVELINVLEKLDLNPIQAGMALATVLGTMAGTGQPEQIPAFKQAVCGTIDRVSQAMHAEKGLLQ